MKILNPVHFLRHFFFALHLSGRTITDLTWGEPRFLMVTEQANGQQTRMVAFLIRPGVLMILDTIDKVQLRDPDFNLDELQFWKVDISRAFTWLDFQPSDIHYGTGDGK